MPTYKYEAAYSSGEKVNGVVEAVSQTEAVAQIRQSCEIVLSLKEVPKAVTKDPFARFQKISAKSLALTCQQFSIILKALCPSTGLLYSCRRLLPPPLKKCIRALLRCYPCDQPHRHSISHVSDSHKYRGMIFYCHNLS